MIWRASVPASRLPLCGRMISGFTAEHREGQASACPAAHAPPTPAVPAVPAVPAAIWSARDKLRAVRGGAPRRPPLVPAHLRVRGARHRFPSAPRAEGSPSLPILPGLRILRVPLRARLSSGGGHAAIPPKKISAPPRLCVKKTLTFPRAQTSRSWAASCSCWRRSKSEASRSHSSENTSI